MSTRTTFLLFCLAAVSAVFIWWFEWTPNVPVDETSGVTDALSPFDADTDDYLGIQRGEAYIE